MVRIMRKPDLHYPHRSGTGAPGDDAECCVVRHQDEPMVHDDRDPATRQGRNAFVRRYN
jgi:hypothetical protein